MSRSQVEGSTEATKWSICLDIILHWNGSLLVASFIFHGLASELLFFIFQRSSCWEKKTKYFIYIDKRIAILELLTQRHKLRSQFSYLLCKFGIVREFVSKPSFYFCYNRFIKRVQLVTLNHLKNRYSAHMKWNNLIKMPFLSNHPPYISWFYLNKSIFSPGINFSIY